MKRNLALIALWTLLLPLAACSQRSSAPQLIVEIPAGFSGDFVLEMGVRSAAPLAKEGDAYKVTVPVSGKVETSTFLERSKVTFRNKSGGSIWGYSQSLFTTGDGISTGGKVEFFVGTQKEYEADQIKKNHSRDFHLEVSQG